MGLINKGHPAPANSFNHFIALTSSRPIIRLSPFPHDRLLIGNQYNGNIIISASFKRLVGGEIDDYTKLLAEAREQAIDRMIAEARARVADAIVGMRFTSSEITDGAAEFVAYGTAVKLA